MKGEAPETDNYEEIKTYAEAGPLLGRAYVSSREVVSR